MANSAIDIQLHDTYFILEKWLLIALGFLCILFIASLIAGIISKFDNKLFNWTLFSSGLLLFAFFTYLYVVSKF